MWRYKERTTHRAARDEIWFDPAQFTALPFRTPSRDHLIARVRGCNCSDHQQHHHDQGHDTKPRHALLIALGAALVPGFHPPYQHHQR